MLFVKRQLESANGLVTLVGFFAIVAVRLLQLRELSRSNPLLPAQHFVPPMMLNILIARLGLLSNNFIIGEFWKSVARLGGFLGRKSDGLQGKANFMARMVSIDRYVLGC